MFTQCISEYITKAHEKNREEKKNALVLGKSIFFTPFFKELAVLKSFFGDRIYQFVNVYAFQLIFTSITVEIIQY